MPEMPEVYTCSVGCGFKGLAERMRNLDRKQVKGGVLVVVCPRDGRVAESKGFRTFRLSETLRWDAEREKQRIEAGALFQAMKKAEEKKLAKTSKFPAKKQGEARPIPNGEPAPAVQATP